MSDLIALVPDKNTETGISSLLCRYKDLGIRKISYKIIIHPKHDPGVYKNPVDLLRPLCLR